MILITNDNWAVQFRETGRAKGDSGRAATSMVLVEPGHIKFQLDVSRIHGHVQNLGPPRKLALCLDRPELRVWYVYTDTSIRVTSRELCETLE